MCEEIHLLSKETHTDFPLFNKFMQQLLFGMLQYGGIYQSARITVAVHRSMPSSPKFTILRGELLGLIAAEASPFDSQCRRLIVYAYVKGWISTCQS